MEYDYKTLKELRTQRKKLERAEKTKKSIHAEQKRINEIKLKNSKVGKVLGYLENMGDRFSGHNKKKGKGKGGLEFRPLGWQ